MVTDTERPEVSCEVAVIGGGLAGLIAARGLHRAGADVLVIEAADLIGGRIHSLYDDAGLYLGDLGPTWVWPEHQPHVSYLIGELGLELFPQFETGEAVVEITPELPPSRQDLPGQLGIARIVGGPQAIVDGVARDIVGVPLHLNAPVHRISRVSDYYLVQTPSADFKARKLVLAAPLRRLARGIEWDNTLSGDLRAIMRSAPTWMAAQAKIVVTYDTPFWRKDGLSGRIVSRLGPLVELHDHCGPEGHPAALFGFVGLPPDMRETSPLRREIKDQLVRCLGPKAATFTRLKIMDWAGDPNVSTPGDIIDPGGHPQVLPQPIREVHDNMVFCAAETALHHPGLIDGAVEAGTRAAQLLSG